MEKNASRGGEFKELELSNVWTSILCGGTGSRLWPISQPEYPKPFQSLWGEEPLVQQTLSRVSAFVRQQTLLVGNQTHAHHLQVAANNFGLDARSVVLEPSTRNTAASIALICSVVAQTAPDATIVVLPSDHVIKNRAAHQRDLEKAIWQAKSGALVLLGKPAESADTGFGYIHTTEPVADIARVLSFQEKPQLHEAQDWLAKGSYWNVGIFVFKANSMIDHFKRFQPEIWRAVNQGFEEAKMTAQGALIGEAFSKALKLPFDTAIVEQHPNRTMVAMTSDWRDGGTWASWQSLQEDDDGVATHGPVQVSASLNSLVYSTGPKVQMVGAHNLAVIATDESVYVAPLNTLPQLPDLFPGSFSKAGSDGADNRAQQALDWLCQDAFPIWTSRGFDQKNKCFAEALTLDGSGIWGQQSLSTQARQVIAIAKYAGLGWSKDAQKLACFAFRNLENWPDQQGEWPAVRDKQCHPIIPVTSSYAMAQVLRACSAFHSLDARRSEKLASRVMGKLEELLLKAGGGVQTGFAETAQTEPEVASADAHMHIIDATQSWMNKAQCDRAQRLSQEGWKAFFHHFYDENNWRVSELPDHAEKRGPWSPGHHFEWVRLWRTGQCDSSILEDFSTAQQLWATATSFGQTETKGLSALLVDGIGPGSNETRAWVQCEKLRAAIIMDRPAAEIHACYDVLFQRHINPARPGLWYDRLETKQGRLMSVDVPASIFHHIILALEAFIDWQKNHS